MASPSSCHHRRWHGFLPILLHVGSIALIAVFCQCHPFSISKHMGVLLQILLVKHRNRRVSEPGKFIRNWPNFTHRVCATPDLPKAYEPRLKSLILNKYAYNIWERSEAPTGPFRYQLQVDMYQVHSFVHEKHAKNDEIFRTFLIYMVAGAPGTTLIDITHLSRVLGSNCSTV